MYEAFPGNYVWNLSVNIALCMGGTMGEIDPANAKVREIARQGDDAGTGAFFDSWMALGDRVAALGVDAERAGKSLSASEKYMRATGYYVTAERMERQGPPKRAAAYQSLLDTMAKVIEHSPLKCERVEIPYEGISYPALFVPGEGEGPRPCMVFCNGLDSVKEAIFLCIRDEFSKRGVSCLMVDQPGVGEALRQRGMTAVVESERWASAAVDWLETRTDVDGDRLGMMGWSLGGYYAPRAAAFEPRFKLCVSWGANPDWGLLQRRRFQREGDRPVPHYWDHVMWVWGQTEVEAFLAFADQVNLHGVTERIAVPYLITHGEGDRQIPLAMAHECFEAATASPRRELKVFTAAEGGVEHCSADNMEPVRSYICDWIADGFRTGL